MENKPAAVEELKTDISSMVGLTCWSVIAGPGSGSLVTLSFGKKMPRTTPLRNSKLSAEQRQFEGEYELYIECAWRLESKDEVICTSTSSNEHGSIREQRLLRLPGQVVSTASISSPGFDLRLCFDYSTSLIVFADQANETDCYVNYTFLTPRSLITIGPRSSLEMKRRSIGTGNSGG